MKVREGILVKFGSIRIGENSYEHDVIIHSDGSVSRRKKELSRALRSRYGHTPLTTMEVKELIEERPDVIVIGTGMYGALPLLDVEDYILSSGIECIVAKTPEAVEVYEQLCREGKRVAAIFHITC